MIKPITERGVTYNKEYIEWLRVELTDIMDDEFLSSDEMETMRRIAIALGILRNNLES